MQLFHLTHPDNLCNIRQCGQLFSAAELLKQHGKKCLREKRNTCCELSPGIVLNDQKPLQAGHVELSGFNEWGDFVEFLNRHVFFWTNNKSKNGFEKKYNNYILLTCDLPDLKETTSPKNILFSQYNSGAPRTSKGKKSPRSPDMFKCFQGTRAVEIVFKDSVYLPKTTLYSKPPWNVKEKLFDEK